MQFGRFDTITDDEWDRIHAVDLKGPFMVMQDALPHLRATRGANIINVSSVAGRVPQGYTVGYSAAKGGLTQMTRSLALELAPHLGARSRTMVKSRSTRDLTHVRTRHRT